MSEVKSSAHKHFWIIVILVAALVFGMIYFLSITQAKEDKESALLEDKLNAQISTTKGIEASVQKMTAENQELKTELEEKKNEALELYKENKELTNFIELQNAYINGNKDKCKDLIAKIIPEDLNEECMAVYNKISAELNLQGVQEQEKAE